MENTKGIIVFENHDVKVFKNYAEANNYKSDKKIVFVGTVGRAKSFILGVLRNELGGSLARALAEEILSTD